MKVRASFLWITTGILFHLFVAMFTAGFMDWIDEKQEAPINIPRHGRPHHGYHIYRGEPFSV